MGFSMKSRIGGTIVASALAIAGACLVPTAASAATTCTHVVGGYSQTYDYAWITDYNNDCAYTAVRHYYYPNGNGLWTAWYGGALYHYETPHQAQMTAVGWAWTGGSNSKSAIPA